MSKIPMKSTQIHKFGGKLRKKGEIIQCTFGEARTLMALGRAKGVDPEPLPPVAPVETPKRKYQRKDVAKTPENVALEPEEPPKELNAWPYPRTVPMPDEAE